MRGRESGSGSGPTPHHSFPSLSLSLSRSIDPSHSVHAPRHRPALLHHPINLYPHPSPPVQAPPPAHSLCLAFIPGRWCTSVALLTREPANLLHPHGAPLRCCPGRYSAPAAREACRDGEPLGAPGAPLLLHAVRLLKRARGSALLQGPRVGEGGRRCRHRGHHRSRPDKFGRHSVCRAPEGGTGFRGR